MEEEFFKLLESSNEKGERHIDIARIREAYDFAKMAHAGQLRKSGEEYFIHPVAVASILVEYGMDTESIIAGLLHDVVEDTEYSLEYVKEKFGEEIALLVDGVTKLGRVPYTSREEQRAENVRKMLLAMAQDIRVMIIKLADRLHNMRTIQYLRPQKMRDIALETMEVYAPIAHRLGIRAIKEELEDRSIHCLDPVGVKEIEDSIALHKNEREEFLDSIKEKIRVRIMESVPNCYIEGRIKSVNGIYRKIYVYGKNFEEIYDIYAVRIIVDTVIDCYNVLGLIHDMFRPIPGRFKDYISTPKPNMYQSLHTTVIGKEGVPFEVQIRTWEMHHTAEYGVAAHWKYKAGINGKDKLEERLAWVRQLIENQKDSEDVEDIVRMIKTDLAPEEVYILTPKGDVINLPAGSTVIDFAYAIHSAVGNRMVGAKVGGRIVPLSYKVQTGEIIEILTTGAQGHGPSRDWLKIVKTSEARNKIRQWFKKEKREENIAEGKAELQKEFTRNSIILSAEQYDEFLNTILKRAKYNGVEDFYAAIGYGGVVLSRLMPRIKEDYSKLVKEHIIMPEDIIATPSRPKKAKDGVIVEGLDNCLIKFSRCCNPLPGDEIIGFITRGYGVSIHKRDCPNVPQDISKAAEPERWVKAVWADSQKASFKCGLQITGTNSTGLLAEITVHLASLRVDIHSINAREGKENNVLINIVLDAKDIDHLNSIIEKMRRIPGVIEVERV